MTKNFTTDELSRRRTKALAAFRAHLDSSRIDLAEQAKRDAERCPDCDEVLLYATVRCEPCDEKYRHECALEDRFDYEREMERDHE